MPRSKPRRPSKPRKNEAILSPIVYAEWLEGYLSECGGVSTLGAMERAAKQKFRRRWGTLDKEQVGKRKRTRWQNAIDWAKATLQTSDGRKAIHTRHSRQFEGGGLIILLGLENVSPSAQFKIDWVMKAKRNQNSFRKHCPKCKKKVPLSRKVCDCKHKFRVIPKRL